MTDIADQARILRVSAVVIEGIQRPYTHLIKEIVQQRRRQLRRVFVVCAPIVGSAHGRRTADELSRNRKALEADPTAYVMSKWIDAGWKITAVADTQRQAHDIVSSRQLRRKRMNAPTAMYGVVEMSASDPDVVRFQYPLEDAASCEWMPSVFQEFPEEELRAEVAPLLTVMQETHQLRLDHPDSQRSWMSRYLPTDGAMGVDGGVIPSRELGFALRLLGTHPHHASYFEYADADDGVPMDAVDTA